MKKLKNLKISLKRWKELTRNHFEIFLIDFFNVQDFFRMLDRTAQRTATRKKKLKFSWPKNASAWPWKKN